MPFVNRGIIQLDDCGLSYDTDTANQMEWASFLIIPGSSILVPAAVANDPILGRDVVQTGLWNGTVPTLVRGISSQSTIINGLRMRRNTDLGAAGDFYYWYNGSTIVAKLTHSIDNTFAFAVTGGAIYTSPSLPYSINEGWHYYEFIYIAGDNDDGTFAIYIDGDDDPFYLVDNITTTNNGNPAAIAYNGNFSICDYYISTTTRLRDTTVAAYFPHEDFSPNTFTGTNPHYAQVDATVPDNNPNLTADEAAAEQYTFPVIPLTTDIIFAVMPAVNAQKNVAGDVQVTYQYENDLAAVFDLGTSFPLAVTWGDNRQQIFEANPDTATNWTRTNINTGGFGFKRD